MKAFLALLALGSCCSPLVAQVSLPPDSPIGHWAPEHPKSTGLTSWCDFRADGTLTVYFGGMNTSPVQRSGDVVIMPSGQAGLAPIHVTVRVEGEVLHMQQTGSQPPTETTYTRVGPPASANDPLLGKWKPLLPATATPSPDPQKAAMEKVHANSITVFSADGTMSVRVPIIASEGGWNAAEHSYQLQQFPGTLTFVRSGPKLILGGGPGGETQTFIPDPIL